MTTSLMVSQLRQLQHQRSQVDKLRVKREEIFSRAIAEIEVLDEQIDALERGEDAQPKAKTKTASVAKKTGEIKVFKSGGRGKKQCPNCEVFVGAKSQVCVCGYDFKDKKQGSPPTASQPKKGRNSEGGTARDGVILVLEEASAKDEGLELKDVNVRYVTKYPDRVKGVKPESINSQISGILGKLVKEGLVVKDLESRTYSLKKVVAKKPKKKSKTKAA